MCYYIHAVINSADDCHQLQNDLNTLDQWANKWRMVFNPSKCEYLKITNKTHPVSMQYHKQLKRSLMPDIYISGCHH